MDFTENIRELMRVDSVYEGQHDGKISGISLYQYNCGLTDVKRWLRSVLMRELSESNYEAARVILYLPLEELEIQVSAKIDVKLAEVIPYDYEKTSCSATSVFVKGTPELISTPIGEMDIYTYQAIMEDADNPVRLLYRYFSSMLDKLRQLVGEEPILSEAILREHKVQDELKLYRMDSILRSMNEFFTSVS